MKTMASHYETSAGVGRAAGEGEKLLFDEEIKDKTIWHTSQFKGEKVWDHPHFCPPSGGGARFSQRGA